MRKRIALAWILAATIAAFSCGGCRKQDTDRPRVLKGQLPPPGSKKTQPAAPGTNSEPADPPAPPKKKEIPTIPKVDLGKELNATCLVTVGKAMPEGQLPDLQGKPASLRPLFGPKATVILFWSSDNPYALQALRKLEGDVVEPFGNQGVRAIGINEKEKPEAVKKAVETAGATFPVLLDADGAYFAKVATKQLPRVYLLDSKGTIRWLDVEYSGITRESLKRAIEAVLGEK